MKGRVEVYCGQGKGKTSSALGHCIKAAGQGKQVIIVQFLKGKDTEELVALVSGRDEELEVIMTGRRLPDSLKDWVDDIYCINTIKES